MEKGYIGLPKGYVLQPAFYYTTALRPRFGDFGRQLSSHVTMTLGEGGGLARKMGLCLTRLGVWFVILSNSIDETIE